MIVSLFTVNYFYFYRFSLPCHFLLARLRLLLGIQHSIPAYAVPIETALLALACTLLVPSRLQDGSASSTIHSKLSRSSVQAAPLCF